MIENLMLLAFTIFHISRQDALGRWEEAVQVCGESIDGLKGDKTHQKAAVIGARAAWSLNNWQEMDSLVSQLPADNVDASFLRAVLAVRNDDFQAAADYVDNTRKHLDDSITALLAESYSRAYVPLVMLQQLSELEEIMGESYLAEVDFDANNCLFSLIYIE